MKKKAMENPEALEKQRIGVQRRFFECGDAGHVFKEGGHWEGIREQPGGRTVVFSLKGYGLYLDHRI